MSTGTDNLHISRWLRFSDPLTQAQYTRTIWTPRNMIGMMLIKLVFSMYYAVMAFFGSTSQWKHFDTIIGGRKGVFSIAIASYEAGIAVYCFVILQIWARARQRQARESENRAAGRASDDARDKSARWFRVHQLDPRKTSYCTQMAIFAIMVWPPLIVRNVALAYTCMDLMTGSFGTQDDFDLKLDYVQLPIYSWEVISYITATLFTYGPLLTLVQVPGIIIFPTGIVAALGLVIFAAAGKLYITMGFTILMGAISIILVYLVARLPLEQYRGMRMEKKIAQTRSLTLATIAHDIGTPLNALVLAFGAMRPAEQPPSPDSGRGELKANGSSTSVGTSVASEASEAVDVSLHAIAQLRKTILNHVANEVGHEDSKPAPAIPRLQRVHVQSFVDRSIMPVLKQLVKIHNVGNVVAKSNVRPGALPSINDVIVVADPDWLLDMFLNLIGNSVKFTESGHVAIECWVRNQDEAGIGSEPIFSGLKERAPLEVVCAVEDTGPGIRESAAKKLFRPFAQVEGTRGGTGLGLSSVAAKAASMGGVCGISRNVHGGATVWFTVPLASAERSMRTTANGSTVPRLQAIELPSLRDNYKRALPRDDDEGSEGETSALLSADSRAPPADLSNMRVLIADNSPAILKLMQSALEKSLKVGEVVAASSGEDAKRLIREREAECSARQFDLVMIDHQMKPGHASACDVAEYLRGRQRRGEMVRVCLVLLTGVSRQQVYAEDPRVDELFNHVLEKPVSPARLKSLLMQVASLANSLDSYYWDDNAQLV